jgi:hypothetical protein
MGRWSTDMRLNGRHAFWFAVLALTTVLTTTGVAQSVALKRVMQQKLEHSQLILASVVTTN